MSPRVTTERVRELADKSPDRWSHPVGDVEIGYLAADLLDARDRLAAVERERDDARGQALHWSTLNSEPGNRCYQLQCLQNGVAHGIARVWEDSDLWFVTDRNRHIPALSAFDSAHEAARAVCDALGLPLIAAGLPGEDGAS